MQDLFCTLIKIMLLKRLSLLESTAEQVKNACQKLILNIIFAHKIFLLKENCNITINWQQYFH